MNDDKQVECKFIDELQSAKFKALKVPQSFLDAIKCKTAWEEYQDWVEFLRNQTEELFRKNIINNGSKKKHKIQSKLSKSS